MPDVSRYAKHVKEVAFGGIESRFDNASHAGTRNVLVHKKVNYTLAF